MIPQFKEGDWVLYNNKCYQIENRNHEMVGIGYNLKNLDHPVNQPDISPCPCDMINEQNITIDIQVEIIDDESSNISSEEE